MPHTRWENSSLFSSPSPSRTANNKKGAQNCRFMAWKLFDTFSRKLLSTLIKINLAQERKCLVSVEECTSASRVSFYVPSPSQAGCNWELFRVVCKTTNKEGRRRQKLCLFTPTMILSDHVPNSNCTCRIKDSRCLPFDEESFLFDVVTHDWLKSLSIRDVKAPESQTK